MLTPMDRLMKEAAAVAVVLDLVLILLIIRPKVHKHMIGIGKTAVTIRIHVGQADKPVRVQQPSMLLDHTLTILQV